MDFARKITKPDHLKMTSIDAMYNIKVACYTPIFKKMQNIVSVLGLF